MIHVENANVVRFKLQLQHVNCLETICRSEELTPQTASSVFNLCCYFKDKTKDGWFAKTRPQSLCTMFLLNKPHHFCAVIPLFTAFIWSSTLLSMLLTWLVSGRPKYVPTQAANIAYVSDIGASFLKPLFVTACCITGPGFVLSLVLACHLRHQGKLAPEQHSLGRIYDRLSIVCAVIAMFGLALLSGFDTMRYPTEHLIFLSVFIVGVSLSAIFTVLEFRLIARDHPQIKGSKTAYCVKAVIGLSLVGLEMGFVVSFFALPDVGGVIEWTIAFGFTFYLLTFAYDLRMAKMSEVVEESIEWKVLPLPVNSLKDNTLMEPSTILHFLA